MSGKDSFLELIGLDSDELAKSEASSSTKTSSVTVKDIAFESDPDSGEVTQLDSFQEDSFAESLRKEVEEAELNQDEAPESDDEETVSEEASQSFSQASFVEDILEEKTELFSSDEKPFEPQDLYADELENANTHFRSGNSEPNPQDEEDSRTGLLTKEDALLEGLEEAEYSRATDLFVVKSKAEGEEEARKTEAILGALEEFDDPAEDPLEELLSEESASQSTKSILYEAEEAPQQRSFVEGRDSVFEPTIELEASSGSANATIASARSEDTGRQTMAFQYQDESEAYGRIIVLEGGANLDELIFQEFPIRVGRGSENDLILEDDNSSRFHCEFQDREGELWVQDLGSTNGLKVNGALTTEHKIEHGDLIQIGEVLIEFVAAGESPQGGRAATQEARTQIGKSNRRVKKKRLRLVMTAGAFLIAAGLFAWSQMGGFDLQRVTTEYLATNLKEEMFSLQREFPEASFESLQAEDLKVRALERARAHPVLNQVVDRLETFPADYFVLFLSDPEALEAFVATGGDSGVLMASLRSQLNGAIHRRERQQAGRLFQLWRMIEPENSERDRLQSDFEAEFRFVETPEAPVVTQEEKDFVLGILRQHQETYEELLRNQQFATAADMAEDVISRILQVIRDFPHYADFAEPMIANWKAKSAQAKRQQEAKEQERQEFQEVLVEGRSSLRQVRALMDEGRAYEAKQMIESFLSEFEEHPDRSIAEDYRRQIQEVIDQTFRALRREIEGHIRTQNFGLAWERVYTYLDQLPKHSGALELRQELLKVTYNRARQFYNQGRVFEFEADDLISAEQYYKRTLEAADPRGELAARAHRRYNEVLRKKLQ
ncbi:MAG: FHA domain-containing protein [Bradymonadales bacterium]|nr:MAG: FHA domain-containing protein [Bradymonadales bacterium]